MQPPARIAAGAFALAVAVLAGTAWVHVLLHGAGWKGVLAGVALTAVASDYGFNGAVRGRWPWLSWYH